jgi:hypothetical protein
VCSQDTCVYFHWPPSVVIGNKNYCICSNVASILVFISMKGSILFYFILNLPYAPWVRCIDHIAMWPGLCAVCTCTYSLGILRNYPVWSVVRSLDLSGNLSYTLLGTCQLLCSLSPLSPLSPLSLLSPYLFKSQVCPYLAISISLLSLSPFLFLSVSSFFPLSLSRCLRLYLCLSVSSFFPLSLSRCL